MTILVNSAGVGVINGLMNRPDAMIKKTFDINTFAPMIVIVSNNQ